MRRKGTVGPALAALLTVGLTAGTAWQLHRAETEAEAHTLEADVGEIHRAIQNRMDTQVTLLRGIAGLLAVDPDVDARSFAVFVNREVRRHFGGMQGIGFAVRMRAPEDEPALARRAQMEGWHVWPPQTSAEDRYPILFLEPRDRRNLAAMGFDMFSEPIRREAMARARETGLPAATAKVVLVQEIDPLKQAGFLLYVPVYEGGGVPETAEARLERHTGFAYSPFRAGDLLESVFGRAGPAYDMDVYDGSGIDPERRLYRFGAGGGDAPLTSTLDVVGRTWTVALAPRATGAAERGPGIVLVGGLVTGALLFALMRGQARARDVAERTAEELRASQEALRLNETRLHRLVETNVVAVAIADRRGTVRETNEAFLALVGRTAQEVHGGRLRWQDLASPELAPLLELSLRDLARTGAMTPRERVLVRGDGTHVPVLLGAAWLGGAEDLWVAFLVDLTEQKRIHEALRSSEARFRTVVEQSPHSMQFFDAEGRVTSVNPAFTRIWGIRAEEMGDYKVLEDPQLEAKGVLPFLRKAFAGHPTVLPTIGYVPEFGENKGRDIWVRAIAYPVRDEHGRIREVVLTHEDVTEHHRAEEALLQAQKLESIGVLAGGIAHDFNNLLTGILGNASLATRYLPADARPRRMMEDVIRAAERAAALTRQLLAYAGKGRFVVKRMDLRDLVQDLTDLLRTSLPKKVRLEVAPGTDPAWVEVDAAQMQQLVMNLVINAGEAIGDDVGRVTVEVGHASVDAVEAADRWGAWNLAPGDYVSLSVRDTGAGMDARTREQIFEPFFTTKFVGRGLGLSAALGIVRAHGGGIDVWSEPGRGSLFTVVLPRKAAPVAEAPPLPGREAVRGAGTVLVVDDEAHIRDLAAASLQEFGYDVLLASEGAEAERVFRERPDVRVVVLDMTMPVMSGEEVLRRLRAVRGDVRVVVSSGWSEEEAERRLAGQGIGAYLQKPWTVEQLAEAVQRAMKKESATV